MRSLVLPYKSSFALSEVMHGSADATLPVPEGAHVGDGEWVVAVVEVAEGKRSSAAAAVGRRSERGQVVAFGALDWERIGGLTSPSSSRPGSVSRVAVSPAEIAVTPDSLRVQVSGLTRPLSISAKAPFTGDRRHHDRFLGRLEVSGSRLKAPS